MSETNEQAFQRGYAEAMKVAALLPCARCELREAEVDAHYNCRCHGTYSEAGCESYECEPHRRLRELRAEQAQAAAGRE